jgi:hypothetical protein
MNRISNVEVFVGEGCAINPWLQKIGKFFDDNFQVMDEPTATP